MPEKLTQVELDHIRNRRSWDAITWPEPRRLWGHIEALEEEITDKDKTLKVAEEVILAHPYCDHEEGYHFCPWCDADTSDFNGYDLRMNAPIVHELDCPHPLVLTMIRKAKEEASKNVQTHQKGLQRLAYVWPCWNEQDA